MDSMPDFLALIADRPAAEVEFALAVAAVVAHHMDQQKEHSMAKKPIDFDEFNDRRKAVDPELQRLAEYARPVGGRDRSLDDDIERMERMQQAQDGRR